MNSYNRYHDLNKFITDSSKLSLDKEDCVYISGEDDYDIAVCLRENSEDFEKLKPFLIFLAKNICRLDNTVQKFNHFLYPNEKDFPHELMFIYIDGSDIILDYWGTSVNTQWDAVFSYTNDTFTLKSFGTLKDIPKDWEQ